MSDTKQQITTALVIQIGGILVHRPQSPIMKPGCAGWSGRCWSSARSRRWRAPFWLSGCRPICAGSRRHASARPPP